MEKPPVAAGNKGEALNKALPPYYSHWSQPKGLCRNLLHKNKNKNRMVSGPSINQLVKAFCPVFSALGPTGT